MRRRTWKRLLWVESVSRCGSTADIPRNLPGRRAPNVSSRLRAVSRRKRSTAMDDCNEARSRRSDCIRDRRQCCRVVVESGGASDSKGAASRRAAAFSANNGLSHAAWSGLLDGPSHHDRRRDGRFYLASQMAVLASPERANFQRPDVDPARAKSRLPKAPARSPRGSLHRASATAHGVSQRTTRPTSRRSGCQPSGSSSILYIYTVHPATQWLHPEGAPRSPNIPAAELGL
jgi:hypothetical protein